MMKKDATLINCARGPVIDEVALTNFLQANENFRCGNLSRLPHALGGMPVVRGDQQQCSQPARTRPQRLRRMLHIACHTHLQCSRDDRHLQRGGLL